MQEKILQSYKLSPQQRRTWALGKAAPDYRAQCAVHIEGDLRIELLKQAVYEIIRRHEILRTTFQTDEAGTLVQKIESQLDPTWRALDLADCAAEQQAARLDELWQEQSNLAFRLEQGPLLYITLVQLAPDRHVLMITLPALCADAWALKNLVGDISRFYRAGLQGDELPDEEMQYADLSEWQNELFESSEVNLSIRYWREQVADYYLDARLPYERDTGWREGFRPESLALRLKPEMSAAIEAASRHHHIAVSTFLLTCWRVILHRLIQENDITLGVTFDGRGYDELQAMPGLFAKCLPLTCSLDNDLRFSDVLRQIDEAASIAYKWQEGFSWDEVIGVRANDDANFFSIAYEYQMVMPEHSVEGLSFGITKLYNCIDRFKIKLNCFHAEDRLIAEFHYDGGLYSAPDIERMAVEFERLIESAIENAELKIGELKMLGRVEREQLLFAFNATDRPLSAERLIHQLIEEQVDSRPGAIALSFQDQQPTYQELDCRANQLANYLQSLGVGPEVFVGVCLNRSIDMVVAILAILKSGGAYLPLDPTYPMDRLEFMLQDAQVPVLLTEEQLSDSLPALFAQVVYLDTDRALIGEQSEQRPETKIAAANAAYVIYTSGSTGKPKGVVVEHKGLGNLVQTYIREFSLQPDSRILQFASLSFDASVPEIFMALAAGAQLCLATQDDIMPGPDLLRVLRDQAITNVTLPPSTLAALPNADLADLQSIIVAGEACTADLVARWGTERLFVNAYGPTEASVCASLARCVPDGNPPPIGHPIDNVRVYILDANLEPAPMYVSGELYIGGIGLARGYLNRADLTAERFIPDPFGNQPGARLYKTGDVARHRADGSIEYIGRLDHQLKLRGYRIELGEIAAVLKQNPLVRDAIAVAREDEPGDKRLVAYVVCDEETTPGVNDLMAFLRQKLPEYMIPASFVMLREMPLTPSGKIDRKALPAPAGVRPDLDGALVMARTPVEQLLAEIWAELLRVERIGVHDNFFDLGGHSLLGTELLSRIRETFKVEMNLRVLFEWPTIAGLAQHVEAQLKGAQQAPAAPIQPVSRDARLPLSFAQQRLWFLHQLQPDSPAYNLPGAVYLKGQLDRAALAASLNEMRRRHEVLRTCFAVLDGEAVQVIADPEPLPLAEIDLSHLGDDQRQARAQQEAEAEAQRPFDLKAGPVLRVKLLKMSEDEQILLFTMHHIVSDAWSMRIMVREVRVLYEAYKAGQASPLEEPELQYADFAVWQRQWLSGDELARQLGYWRQRLEGAPEVLELRTDKVRPAVQTYRGAEERFEIDEEVSSGLRRLSRREGVTMFMTLLAGFEVLLYKYSGQEEVVVGVPIANRNRAEVEKLVGFFVNTLVMRGQVRGEKRYEELLREVREETLGGYVHQDLPFDKLVEDLKIQRDLNRTPLFQVMFAFENVPDAPASSELEGEWLKSDSGSSQFDLILAMTESGDGKLSGLLEYNTDLYKEATIKRMIGHFQTLLESISIRPNQRIADLALLTAEQRQQVIFEWSGSQSHFQNSVCLHELFRQQALLHPNHVAVSFQGQSLSYRELDLRSNQLAHFLRGMGIGAESLVALCLNRSIDMVVAILGVLKAGAAYVPLDPAYPKQRLAFMLEDSRARLVLTEESLIDALIEQETRLVALDRQWAAIAESPTDEVESRVIADNAAYVIYTSGSTGKPKGVVVTHRNVVRLFEATERQMKFSSADVWSVFHSFAFDFSVWEMWGALLYGGKAVVIDYLQSRNPEEFLRELSQQQVTILSQTPSAFKQLMEAEERDGARAELSLRLVVFGGEALELKRLAGWMERHGDERPELINMYGITETTVHVTYRRITERDVREGAGSVIGEGLEDLRVYVLDERMEVVGEGIVGEIYVGGGGVARGYLRREELTAERFIADPYAQQAGERMYRSGDLGRYIGKGEIEYLGRKDAQVKIRGHRIETGEIEEAIRESLGREREVKVIARDEGGGEKRLVGYVVERDGEEVREWELRRELKERLPEYMVPVAIVKLKQMPLTAHGKIDLRALPAPEEMLLETDDDVFAPRTEIELLLANLWTDLLHIEPIGVADNFFDLGGHSLLATQLITRIRETFKVEMNLRVLFEWPTIAGLAQHVEAQMKGAQQAPAAPIQPVSRDARLPLSFAQQRLWFLHQLQPDSPAYNLPGAVYLKGQLDRAALAASLNEMRRRHEVLRTSFAVLDGEAVQVIAAPEPLPLAEIDLSHLGDDQRQARAQQEAEAEAQRPFDLARGPVLRVTLLKMSDDEQILLFTMHHIVSDAWSMRIMVREVRVLYEAYKAGQASPLEEPELQYADFAVWQRQWLSGDELARQLGYWRQRLEGAPEVLELRTDKVRPAVQTYRGAEERFEIDEEVSSGLRRLSRREGVTMFMTLLAGFEVLLHKYSGQEEVVVGVPIANRNRAEVEKLVGFFVNTLVMRGQVRGEKRYEELLREVREETLGGYVHQDLPFDKLVEDLKIQRSLSYTPVFQVTFNLQNAPPPGPLADVTPKHLEAGNGSVPFDLSLNMFARGHKLTGSALYSLDLFEPATINRMMEDYHMLLRKIADNPQATLSELINAVDEAVRQQQALRQRERKEARRLKLHSVKRKAVEL